jgi:glycosyltransferase involved in cell wall biosynthesis
MRSGLRIAMVAACPFPLGRGTPIRIQREAEALTARGHEVHIVTYSLGTADPVSGVTVHRTPRLPGYRTTSPGPTYQKLLALDSMLVATLFRLLRAQPIDVIHAHHYEGLLVARAAKAFTKTPIVYDAHTMLGSELAFFRLGLPGRFTVPLGHYLDRRLPKLADHIISVTETIRDHLIAGNVVSDAQISVIGNGVELEQFRPDLHPPWASDALRRIVFTGNLAPYQGVDILLQGFAAAASRRRDIRLRIVTDSDFSAYEPSARQLGIRDLIEVVSAPSFADVPAFLETAHVAVNPRLEADGIPLKLLNYMAAGKPIVSFKGSAPGLIHEHTAWLIAGSDPADFGRGILALLEDPERAQAMGRRARSLAEQHYRWPVLAERIERIYQDLLEPVTFPALRCDVQRSGGAAVANRITLRAIAKEQCPPQRCPDIAKAQARWESRSGLDGGMERNEQVLRHLLD